MGSPGSRNVVSWQANWCCVCTQYVQINVIITIIITIVIIANTTTDKTNPVFLDHHILISDYFRRAICLQIIYIHYGDLLDISNLS